MKSVGRIEAVCGNGASDARVQLRPPGRSKESPLAEAGAFRGEVAGTEVRA